MVCIHQQFAFFPPIVFLRLIYVDICSLIYSFSLLYNFSLNDYVTAYSFIPLLMDMVDNSRFFLLFWLSFYVLFLFIYLFVFGWFCLLCFLLARRKATCYTWLLRQEFLFSKNLRKGFLLRVSMCIIILEVLANRVKQEKEKAQELERKKLNCHYLQSI